MSEGHHIKDVHPDLEWRHGKLDKHLPISDWWLWPKRDTGSFGGPFNDWQTHRTKYFEHMPKKWIGEPKREVADGHTIITAGGNMGAYVRAYGEIFGHVYAFEPVWLSFVCMVANNPRRNVHCMNMALGAKPGWCVMDESNKNNMGCNHVMRINQGKVPMVTIDQFGFENVDMIQLDVEGYEEKVLLGAEDTVRRCQPILIVERQPDSQFRQWFEKMGYFNTGQSCADYVYVHKSKLNM